MLYWIIMIIFLILCIITSPVPLWTLVAFMVTLIGFPIVLALIAKKDSEVIDIEKVVMNDKEYQKRLKEHGNKW